MADSKHLGRTAPDLRPDDPAAEEATQPIGVPGSPRWPRYRSWMEQPVQAPSRHAAITRTLYSWANYKSWADKVRSDWKDDD
jgi:hypothetical protein